MDRKKITPMFEGTPLAKARKVIDRRAKNLHRNGKVVVAIDADCEEYKFESTADVERQTKIRASRLSALINRYKKGKSEVPLCEGFCWMYEEDREELEHKIKAWIALNAADNRKTHI